MITKETVTDFFNDLDQKGDFDYSMPLLWGFFFLSSNLKQLKSLGTELEFKGYSFVDVFEAEMESKNEPQEYYLHLERVEIHSIASILERNEELYKVADKYSVEYDGFDVGQLE